MDQQELEAALSLLIEDLEGDMGDVGDLYGRLTQVLNGLRAFGMPLPDDLVRLEKELAQELAGLKSKP
ncbi:MAG: hypothetical protein WCF16_07885 [Alphaproteobacteria bacterium]